MALEIIYEKEEAPQKICERCRVVIRDPGVQVGTEVLIPLRETRAVPEQEVTYEKKRILSPAIILFKENAMLVHAYVLVAYANNKGLDVELAHNLAPTDSE